MFSERSKRREDIEYLAKLKLEEETQRKLKRERILAQHGKGVQSTVEGQQKMATKKKTVETDKQGMLLL